MSFSSIKTVVLPEFPDEFATLSNWVVWRYETRDGKKTKVPYSPLNSARGAKSNDSSTWAALEQAQAAQVKGGFDGVGFQFSGTDLTGIDLDWKGYQGEGIPPQAMSIIDYFSSYTELSPSGKGCHIIIIGKLPEGSLNRAKLKDSVDLEVYSEGRYFTMTGDILENATLEQRQAHLNTLAKRRLTRPERAVALPERAPAQVHNLGDSDLLEKAMGAKNGAAFRQLWNGDASGQDGDHSRADLALCKSLLFWFGPHDADRMFRSSGLMRDKWDTKHSSDGRTYGEMTLGVALSGWDGQQYTPFAQAICSEVSPLELGQRYAVGSKALYLHGESILRAAQGHHMSKNSYWLAWAALSERMKDSKNYGAKNGRLFLRLGGMVNFAKDVGGKPSEIAGRMRFLATLGFFSSCEKLEPENLKSELVIYLPEDPQSLGMWQLSPESSKSVILEPTSQRGKKPTDPTTPLQCEEKDSRVSASSYPLRNAFRVAQALELHGAMDARRLAVQACKALPTVKKGLEVLQDAGCVTETDGIYTVDWAGYEQLARDEREFSPTFRRSVVNALERSVRFYMRGLEFLAGRTSTLAQRRLRQCRKRYDFAMGRLERLSCGEPVWAVFSS